MCVCTSLTYDYLYCFQYDHGLPSYDHSVCFCLVFLVSLYIIYGTSSIYDRSNVRNRNPIVLCSHGISIMVLDSFHPITIGNHHHRDPMWCNLLETCLRLVSLYTLVLIFPVVLYVLVTLRSWFVIRLFVILVLYTVFSVVSFLSNLT